LVSQAGLGEASYAALEAGLTGYTYLEETVHGL